MLKTKEYKGYTGSFEWDDEYSIYHGRLDDMSHVITFEGNTLDEVIADFKESVDDFIDFANTI